MLDDARIILIVNIILLLIAIPLASIYLGLIFSVRRFHTANNILTGNFCLTGIICCSYWVGYMVVSGFYSIILITSTAACVATQYLSDMVNGLLVYSLSMITINRFLTIIYPKKRLFKTHAWSFTSLAVQWIVAIILPLPILILYYQVNISLKRFSSRKHIQIIIYYFVGLYL